MFVSAAFAQTETPAAGHGEPLPGLEPEIHGELVEHGGGHEGVFPPMDATYFPSQILWLALSFGIFYLVLKRAVLPRIGGIIENRRERVAGDLDAAEKMRADADAAQAAYEQELAEARARSHKIATDARDKAKVDADRERAAVSADLDAKLDAAQARIAEIKMRALADVGQIAEEVTQSILADVAKIEVSPAEISGAVARAR